MPENPIDAYLAAVPEPGRTTLLRLRDRLRELLPEAVETMSYNAPAFKLSPDPPICAYCASPAGPTGIAGTARQTPRYGFAFPASHCTHLVPLATAPTGGFRLSGKVVAGFSALRGHLTYLPHSGSILQGMPERLQGYAYGKGSLRFPLDTPLPDELLTALVDARLTELGLSR